MNYQSTRLGPFEVKDNEIIQFPDGLYGFENETRFALLPFSATIDTPLQWIHSLKTPDLAFVVTDPNNYVPDYKLSLTEEDRKQIGLEFDGSVMVLAIVTIPQNPHEMTANLVAPIVINAQKLIAKQFVLTTPEYHTRHHLLPGEPKETPTQV